MDKRRKNFATGMMAGAIVGATTALVVNPIVTKNKKRRNKSKNQPKLLKNVGNIGNTMSNVVDSIMTNKR